MWSPGTDTRRWLRLVHSRSLLSLPLGSVLGWWQFIGFFWGASISVLFEVRGGGGGCVGES